MLKADFSGTVDQVYEVLMASDGADCTNAATPARVCLAKPEASLLVRKPFEEAPPSLPDHDTAVFASDLDPDYRALLEWIQQGAKR